MSIDDVSPEFAEALRHVVKDMRIDIVHVSDLVAVGVKRADCIELLGFMLEGEDDLVVAAAVAVQVAVATGVWLERARWTNTEPPPRADR